MNRKTLPKQLLFAVVLLACGSASHAAAETCGLPAITGMKGSRPSEITKAGPGTCGFLQFAWESFLGMNWPPLPVDTNKATAQSRGLPDPGKIIGKTSNGDNPTVWEQDQPNWYLFTPNNPPPRAAGGQSFAAWNQDAWLRPACGPLKAKLPAGSPPPRILSSLSKFDAMPGVIQATSAAPLIDQTGYYARYEILMDYPAFNYINSNQFYLESSVDSVVSSKGGKFEFPVQSGNTPGATFIKAAWKTLSADEINSGRFHTARAFMYTSTASKAEQTCVGPVTVGLVGLHIVQKTKDFQQWIWATFEQVDVTPADPGSPVPAPPPPMTWGFFKPGAPNPNAKPKCPDGVTATLSDCDFQPTSSHKNDKTGGPTQAVRQMPIPKSPNQPALGQINKAAQDALRAVGSKNVWQYYQLVEAQWQTHDPPSPPTPSCGQDHPKFFPACKVANMTMETYTQPITCMNCHIGAKAPDPKTKRPNLPSDMTFELGLAWGPTVEPASRVPGLSQ